MNRRRSLRLGMVAVLVAVTSGVVSGQSAFAIESPQPTATLTVPAATATTSTASTTTSPTSTSATTTVPTPTANPTTATATASPGTATSSTSAAPPAPVKPVTPGTPQTAGSAAPSSAAAAVADPVADRWAALGGAAGVLGNPVGSRLSLAGGQVQAYDHGHISWSAATGAWETLSAIDTRYQAVFGPAGALGFPTSAPMAFGGGLWQWFTGGVVWWSAGSGAWETTGAIHQRYNAIGGPWALGFPTSAPMAFGGGLWQWFTGGVVWWSAGSGAWETTGAIHQRYNAIGGPWALGFPTSAPMAFGGGLWQWFTGGVVWWSAGSGAWETTGAIHQRYNAIGGPWALGFPTSAPMAFGGGLWQWFTGGVVWWSAGSGAWETKGAIHQQYNSISGPWSWYGFPTGPQYAYLGGVRQDFTGGSLLAGVTTVVLDATYAPVTAGDVWATYRSGCPVGPSSLTLVRLNFWGFDSQVHRGEIIVRSDLASRVAQVFSAALAERYPIRSMWRVDYYGGDDPTAMAADNTSGFNCRQVTGGTGLSPHSYGIAIDINTVENPYYAGRWWPSTDYVDRNNMRWGMLYSWSLVTMAFQDAGYAWGGSYLDYQHFEFVG